MIFERTTDASLVRSVLTDPAIWRGISDDSSPAREEYEPAMSETIWYVAVRDRAELLGLFVFVPQNAVCWEVHTCLLPHSWGDRAAQASREMSAWIWANTPCRRIVTTVPSFNRLALRFAKEAGLTQYGVNPASFIRDGRLHDQHLLGISPQ
jgi:RimJ/RimL family protein N-acetyltransferase